MESCKKGGSNGLDFATIKCKGEHFATYGLNFLGDGAREPVDVIGDEFPLLESVVEGMALEPEATGEVGAEVAKVEDGVDSGVEGRPGVVVQPVSGALAGGERERLVWGNASA